MKRFLRSSILLVSIFLFLFLHSCKKSEDPNDSRGPNDLFPLKLGNEFYFKYKMERPYIPPYFDETNGLETWVVENVLMQDQNITYIIKRRLNALHTWGYQIDTNKTVIADSSYILVKEDKKTSIISSSFYFSDDTISFRRYQNETRLDIKKGRYNESWTYSFKSDSGLVRLIYYHGPNQVSYTTLILDSLTLNK